MADDRPFHNPFGVLSSLRGSLPERPTPEPPPATAEPPSTTRTIPRAVVRLERAGRGGKDVTIVEHLAIAPTDRPVWLKALKAQLGCGGVVEGEAHRAARRSPQEAAGAAHGARREESDRRLRGPPMRLSRFVTARA